MFILTGERHTEGERKRERDEEESVGANRWHVAVPVVFTTDADFLRLFVLKVGTLSRAKSLISPGKWLFSRLW